LTVHFKRDNSSDTGACSFSTGTLSFTGTGNCILDANQSGSATYSAASQQQQQITVWPQSGGTMTRSVMWVPAGATGRTIAFVFKAPPSGLGDGNVRLTVPDGWSPPSLSKTAAGYSSSSTGTPKVMGRTIVVTGLNLAPSQPFAIIYGDPSHGGPGATTPTSTGAQVWSAKELSSTVGTPAALGVSPTITIVSADGSGLMTANRTSVTHAAQHQTIKFTYTLWPGGMHMGKLTLTVPTGWSAPSTTGSAAGSVTSSVGTVSVSGRTIKVSGITQAAGTTVVITYGSTASGGPGATAPSTGNKTQMWTTKEQSTSTSTLTQLSVSPQIKVN
jgi:hypothetical protein